MAKLEEFALDQDLVDEGIWERVGLGDIEFRICWSGVPKFQRAMARRLKPLERKIKSEKMGEDELRLALVQDVCDILVRDWRNVDDREDYDGKYLAKLLAKPSHKHVLDIIWRVAHTDANYYVKNNPSSAEGNLSDSSDGS